MNQSRCVYVPSAVSSFFEICDRDNNNVPLQDLLQMGARGGGFILEKGTKTSAFSLEESSQDEILINGTRARDAQTSLGVVKLIRDRFHIPPVRISHEISAPIGQGFGTSGAGALATSIALGDLFDLRFTLAKAAEFAHISEITNLTGLGTVISLASGTGAMGLVTEPGTYSVGRTDAILADPESFVLVCVTLGPIKKSIVLKNDDLRSRINENAEITLLRILDDPTPARLLAESRIFSEKTGLASTHLLKLSDTAVESGAVGATPNMIGNAIHCLVETTHYKSFMKNFSALIPREVIFESRLIQSGPKILSDEHNL
jgi:pantoate kinase